MAKREYTENVWVVLWGDGVDNPFMFDGGDPPYSVRVFTRRKEADESVRGIRECGFRARAVKTSISVPVSEPKPKRRAKR